MIGELQIKSDHLAINKVIVLTILFIDILSIFLVIKLSILYLAAIVGILIAYWGAKNTVYGLYLIILLHAFLIKSTEELNIFEIFSGLMLFMTFAGWLVQKILVRKETIISKNTDFWLMAFFGICFFSIIPAIFFSVNLIKWFRELVPFLILLLFYPIVDLVKKKEIQIIAACIFFLGYYVALRNLIMYKNAIESATYFWELTGYRETANEPLLFFLLILSLTFFIYDAIKLRKIFWILNIALFSIALFATFSRGYWVAALMALFFVFLFADGTIKRKLLFQMLAVAIVFLFILEIYFGNIGTFILKAVAERFTSLGQSFKDVSVQGRIAETKAVWDQIKFSPIIGHGLGMTYRFVSPLPREMPTWYVHNGFLYLIFKLGLVGAGAFLAFYFIAIYNGSFCVKSSENSLLKAAIIAVVSCLIAMLPLSISSPQFIQKDSLLIIVFSIGFIELVKRNRIEL